jgi:hypothetical protein
MLMMWPLPVSAMKAMPDAGCQLMVHSMVWGLAVPARERSDKAAPCVRAPDEGQIVTPVRTGNLTNPMI